MKENEIFAEKTDQDLVKMTLENQENFLYLVNRYEDKLRRFILRISNMPIEDAQDLLQEVFIKTYRNLNDFDPSLKFSSWIYRITRNHVISHYRKNKNRPPALSREFNDDVLESFASDFDLGKELDQKMIKKNIEAVLSKMNPKFREVFVLKYFEDKKYEEISDILKKPIGTVATLVSRAKKQFQKNF